MSKEKKDLPSVNQKEKNLVSNEGLSIEKTSDVSAITLAANGAPPLLQGFDALRNALSTEDITEVDVGDDIIIDCVGGGHITGSITFYEPVDEGCRIQLNTGWSWVETETGMRNAISGSQSHIIERIVKVVYE